jgi:cytochrome b6-f complex iron-sulfur subunit
MKPDTTMCSGCAVKTAKETVSRRDFVSAATLSAIAVALTACGGGGGDDVTGPVPPGVGEVTVRLADHPALASMGGFAKVRNSPPVAMTRTSSGLVAFSMSCTHQGTTVVFNTDGTIFCPNHGAEFTNEGVWTGGQRTRNLVRLPVALDSGGTNATITLG